MGAAAAIHVAQKLGAVGIPVRNIVMVEAWNPEPIPANVAAATHFYSTRFAGLIRPGPGNEGLVENIDLNGQIPEIETASHVAMSQMALVQDLVIDKAGVRDDKDQAGTTVAAKSRSLCRDATVAPRRRTPPAPKR
ncbi:hypothetical protein AFCDBAGC_4655 [Methylobacterium cerastii]|uniref:Uncharacterized protein n=2 Tax=Methylobacterium cerastii TaxID=932741 RepID=A0ABQ4QND1_9HYPH|nr:hypothetical protein AFCDBAGC_4655 [Methylobacterium cerastii]